MTFDQQCYPDEVDRIVEAAAVTADLRPRAGDLDDDGDASAVREASSVDRVKHSKHRNDRM